MNTTADHRSDPPVWVFFYGSYMNPEVLATVDLVPRCAEVASVGGLTLEIRPLANLVASERDCAYGIVAQAGHDELDRLYTEHAQRVLGGTYLPHGVTVRLPSGDLRAALVYLAHDMPAQPADPAYVERILRPAREQRFPAWYVERIASFSAP